MRLHTLFLVLLLLAVGAGGALAEDFVWGPGDVPEEFQPLWDLEKVQLPATMTLDETDDSTGYDAKYYNIETQFFTSDHSVKGKVDMTILVTVGPMTYVNLNLRNNMVCDSAKVNGVTAARQFIGTDGLRITCPTPLAQGATAVVSLWYHGIPILLPPLQSGLDWDTHLGTNIISSLSEPDAAHTWWPCKDVPWDKADSVRVVWTVPSNLYATSNGLLQSITTPSVGWKAYTWKERYPITTYLVVVTATNYAHFRNWYVNAANDSLPIDNYVYPEDSLDATLDFADVNQVLAYFASIYGEYPYIEEKFGHAAFPWSGGEEHQTITSIGAMLITGTGTYHWLIVHEASHQWWGDMTTCATWMDIWLNEGFATYSDALWTYHAQGQTAFINRMNSFKQTYFNSIQQEGNFPIYNPTNMWGGTVYQKGAWILHMLRYTVGETDFWNFWPEYRNRYALGNVTTAEFQQTMEDVSGENLDTFFNEWVYMAGYPDYHWGWNSQPAGSQTQVNISIHQDQTITSVVPVFNMTLPFRIATSTGNQMVYPHDSLATQNFSFLVNGTVSNVTCDPDNWILKTTTQGTYVPAPYTVTLAPVSPPVQIPASGGSFAYNVSVTNNQTTSATFTAWIMARQPNGIWSGPYLGPINLTLPAGAVVSRQRTQNIPGSAPAGNYLYEARVGTYPNIILGAANFPFVKLTTGGGPVAIGWDEYGESFEPYLAQSSALAPSAFKLDGAYPNPFNPSTAISYELPAANHVSLRVYDISGRLVATLVDAWRPAGAHQATFDGSGLASGMYLYRLTAGEFSASGKMVLLK